MNDWSYDQHYENDGLGGQNEEHHEVQEDEHHSEQTQMGLEGKCLLHLNFAIYILYYI
jgi:hypothetical protein